MKPKTRSFTIFLLKANRTGPQSLRNPGVLKDYKIQLPDKKTAVLYLQPSAISPPRWLSFFASTLDLADLTNAISANTSAVLFVTRSNRTFAITFGYGRTLLAPGAWEEDFGLKVTLNSVDPQRIRSIDRTSLDAIGQHSRIQASREANIGEFGLDLEQDLLRAVTGKPSDTAIGRQLTGKDALHVTLPLEIERLPGLLDRYLQQWQSTDYKKRFPWIDQIHEVRDPNKVAELDSELVSRLKKHEVSRLWLTIPELIDWGQVEGVKYRNAKSADVHEDVHIDTFLEEVGGGDQISLELMKRRHIIAVSAENDMPLESWPVYRCLYCEIDQQSDTFLLNNGKWYKIGTAFLKRVNTSYDATPITSITLPEYKDKSEGEYNKRVAAEHPQSFALMDQKLIPCGDAYSRIEFCDLYTSDKKLIHVKRYAGSSAPLSHLFAQAVVSGTLFRRDADFRKGVNDILPKPFRSVLALPEPKQYEVVLGVVSASKKKLIIPFFSRVNLKNARDRLENMGYQVSLLKIQATEQQ